MRPGTPAVAVMADAITTSGLVRCESSTGGARLPRAHTVIARWRPERLIARANVMLQSTSELQNQRATCARAAAPRGSKRRER